MTARNPLVLSGGRLAELPAGDVPRGAWVPRIASIASTATLTPSLIAADCFEVTAQTGPLAIVTPTGAALHRQRISIAITDNGTSRAIAWAADYVGASGTALPSATTANKRLRCEFEYDASYECWAIVSATFNDLPPIKLVHRAVAKFPSSASDMTVDLAAMFASSPLREGDSLWLWVAAAATFNLDMSVEGGTWPEFVEAYQNDFNDINAALYGKTVGAVPDASVVIDNFNGAGSASIPVIALVAAYRRVNAAQPIDIAWTNAGGTNGGKPDPAAITPTTNGARICVFGAATHNPGTIAPFTSSDLDNFLSDGLQSADTSPSGRRVVVGFGDIPWSGSGAFNPAAFGGGSSNTDDSWAASTQALRPIT